MISRRIFLSGAALYALCGCQHIEQQQIKPINFADRVHPLTRGGNRLRAGSVYALSDTARADLVMDLGAGRSLDESIGALRTVPKRKVLVKVGDSETVGTVEEPCSSQKNFLSLFAEKHCYRDATVSVAIRSDLSIRTEMTAPFEFLELLNRPVTGLLYNQTAEIRIMQWRTALASASAQGRIFVCTGVETLHDNYLVIRGDVSPNRATAIAHSIVDGNVIEITQFVPIENKTEPANEFSFPIVNTIDLTAVLRGIALVPTSTMPRIDFTLGGVRYLSAIDLM